MCLCYRFVLFQITPRNALRASHCLHLQTIKYLDQMSRFQKEKKFFLFLFKKNNKIFTFFLHSNVKLARSDWRCRKNRARNLSCCVWWIFRKTKELSYNFLVVSQTKGNHPFPHLQCILVQSVHTAQHVGWHDYFLLMPCFFTDDSSANQRESWTYNSHSLAVDPTCIMGVK